MGEFVMHRLFPIVCNMSLTASVVILAVLAVRLLLRRDRASGARFLHYAKKMTFVCHKLVRR